MITLILPHRLPEALHHLGEPLLPFNVLLGILVDSPVHLLRLLDHLEQRIDLLSLAVL